MKKIIGFLLLTVLMQQAFCQTETFDIITYTPPKDWTKGTKEGVVTYATINTTSGTFCVLAIYASVQGLGDVQKDFDKEWNDLVMVPYQAAANPKTDAQSSNGWKTLTGIGTIKIESNDAFAILTVFSGFGKVVSVLATSNDLSYAQNVDDLLGKIKLDKTKKTVATNNTVTTTTATGGNGSFGTVIYSAPAGWNITRYSDGHVLIPADLPTTETLRIWLMPSMNFSGTMEQALQKSYDETVTKLEAKKMNEVNGGNYKVTPAKRSFRGWEYIRCSGDVKIGVGEYPPEFGLSIFLVKVNERYEQIAVVEQRVSCDYSSYFASQKPNYYNDIENFMFSLQFSDLETPILKPGIANGDGITGVWEGITMSVGLVKPGAELGAELKGRSAIFFANGQVLFTSKFPTEGLDGMNTWAKAEQNRRDWGTYSFSNGRGSIKLPYADIPLRMENGKLILTTNQTDHGFIKINSVDGARFNGAYSFSSKTFSGQETGITPTINFTADGKFIDDGGISIMYHTSNSCLNLAKNPGSGTYTVKNHTVTFNYSDGRRIKIAFLGSDYDMNNQSPAVLRFSTNEDPFYKK